MDNKKYSFDLNLTLKCLKQGESVILALVGKKREATLQGLYAARKRNGLALSITPIDNGTKAKVTAL